MASIDEYFASRQCVWGNFTSSGNQYMMVTEIRQQKDSSSRQTLHQRLPGAAVSYWMPKSRDTACIGPDGQTEKGTCALRIVWVPHDRKTGVNDIGHGVLQKITNVFNQELAQGRFRATFAGVASVMEPSNEEPSYWFCNHPHLAMTWSRCPDSGTVNVICIAQQRKIDLLQDMVSCPFIQDLASSELLPSFMCQILLCREVDTLLTDTKSRVQQTESRTGFHGFMNRAETPAPCDLIQLSAIMSGCISNLAVLTRRLGVIHELSRWTAEQMGHCGDKFTSGSIEECSVLTTVEKHTKMQKLDIEFFTTRAQIQRDALLHLITEHGNLANREIAKDSRSLAQLARQDSASMKALAFLAALFIPPTFVSSLFSIPLFDWSESPSESSTSWNRRLVLYLSITAPLMLITFLTLGFFYPRKKQRNQCTRDTVPQTTQSREMSQTSELVALLARRTSLS